MPKVGKYERVLNCLPSRERENDWGLDNAVAAGHMAGEPPIPEKVDLRDSWWKIGDQKDTGSCVGWAAADSVLRWHFQKAGKLDEAKRLSPRFTWMASKETDIYTGRPTTFIESDGTFLKAALEVARKWGAVPDDVLPFESGELYKGEAITFYAIAAKYRISSYFNLGVNLKEWRRWIANNGPILTRLDCDDTWMNALSTDGLLDTYHSESASGGHAVALVGYTKDRFIVRNSWGTDHWGNQGFGFASKAYAQDAFTEAYGVVV